MKKLAHLLFNSTFLSILFCSVVLLNCSRPDEIIMKPGRNPNLPKDIKGLYIVNQGKQFVWTDGDKGFLHYEPESKVLSKDFYTTPETEVSKMENFRGKIIVGYATDRTAPSIYRIDLIDEYDWEFKEGYNSGSDKVYDFIFINNDSMLISYGTALYNIWDLNETRGPHHLIYFSLDDNGGKLGMNGDKIFIVENGKNFMIIDSKSFTKDTAISNDFEIIDFHFDKSGIMWAIAKADGEYHLKRIDTSIWQEESAPFPVIPGENIKLHEQGNSMFLLAKNIYRFQINGPLVFPQPFFQKPGDELYSVWADANRVYVTNARDLASDGALYVLSHSGQLMDSVALGVRPEIMMQIK